MVQHSGLTLAYLGDALIEVAVRKRLIAQGLTKVNDLHKRAIAYTSAVGQSSVAMRFLEDATLSEDELAIYMRGRNAVSQRKPLHVERIDYQRSTGIEALFGYLHLMGNHARIEELLDRYFALIEESKV